ncbi:MAG: glycosyltransferase 87 family protein [Streptosporangiaceae bacterium]
MSARLARPAALALQVALGLAAVTIYLISYSKQHGIGFGPDRIDLGAYRVGARAWLRGANLYGQLPRTPSGLRLSFTYPPIAAVLMAPLALVPMAVADTALTLVTIALVAAVLGLFLHCLTGSGAVPARTLGWLVLGALALEPVRNTLALGQINVILMAMVAFDGLLVSPRWPRGALTGLAAAVKLTPAAFVLFFLLRRDYRAAGTAALAFAAATGAGFVLAGHDSVRYWTGAVFQVGRIGQPGYAGNQSIQGVLARAGLSPHTPAGLAAWLGLCAVVLVVTGLGMRRALAAGERGLALGLNALAALLISPISWSHHWVWCVPVLLTLAILGLGQRGRRARLPLAVAAAGLVIFAAAPQWWFPYTGHHSWHWALWEQAIGSSYVLFGALVLVLAASGLLIRRSSDQDEMDRPAVSAPRARRGRRLTAGPLSPGRDLSPAALTAGPRARRAPRRCGAPSA